MGKAANLEEITYLRQFNEIWDKSGVGVAILNEQLQYVAVNNQLARMHGIPPESHIGRRLSDIVGDLALQLEPALRLAFHDRRPILNVRCAGTLRGASETMLQKCWITSYFPATDSSGAVKRVAAVVIELGPDERSSSRVHLGKHPAEVLPRSDVLRSWKEIAQYVQTCVKTVQRWEREHGFPIHRIAPSKGAMVFALQGEVDLWLDTRATAQHSPATWTVH